MITLSILISGNGIRHLTRVLSRRIKDSDLRHFSILRRHFSHMNIRYAYRAFTYEFSAFSSQRHRVIFNGINVSSLRLLYFSFNFFTYHIDDVSFLPRRFYNARRRTNARFPARRIYPLITGGERITMELSPVAVNIPSGYLKYQASGRFFFRLNNQISRSAYAIVVYF